MAKYRKKSPIFEASQWWKSGDHPAVSDMGEDNCGFIKNPNGETIIVLPGDWIVGDGTGYLFALENGTFHYFYEQVYEKDI